MPSATSYRDVLCKMKHPSTGRRLKGTKKDFTQALNDLRKHSKHRNYADRRRFAVLPRSRSGTPRTHVCVRSDSRLFRPYTHRISIVQGCNFEESVQCN